MDMTRIIVVSDTHGSFLKFNEIIKKHMHEAHCFIHLGDGYDEVCSAMMLYPDLTFYAVRGNNDFFCDLPDIRTIEVCSKTIAFTHGHTYYVKSGLNPLIKCANNISADIILYGHTHKSFTNFDDGLYIMNPGSPCYPSGSSPSYGVIDIQKGNIVLNLVKLR